MNLYFASSRLALAMAGALTLSPTALAQSGREPDPDDRDTIVVTGTATPVEYEKFGQSISVIPAARIEAQGYAYVPDVLRQIPALAVSQAGSRGALTQVRIRGAEANHTLVLFDGIDISSPDQGETDFSTLLAGGLERIEVLRGPQSGLYGSNALAGVVNLVSRKQMDGYYAGASAEIGAFATLAADANAGVGNGDAYAAISINHLSSEGYDVSPDQTVNGVPAVGLSGQPGDKEGNSTTTLSLRGGLSVSDAINLKGVVRYLSSAAELDGQAFGFPIPGRTYDDASTSDHEQLLIGASATIDPYDGAWETTLSASHVDESRRSRLTDFPFLFGPPVPTPAELLQIPLIESGADSTRTTFSVQSTWRFGEEEFAHFVTGFAEAEEETFRDAFINRDESRNLAAIGLQYRAEIARQLYLYATLRHDENDNFQDADTDSYAASWVVPNTGTRLHASYGTGVTAPTFVEQFGFDPGTFIGNAALVPEEAIGWDAGIEQRLFGDSLVLDLTYFSSTLENEIFTSFLPTFETTPLNSASDSDRSGWEITITADPTDDISLYGSWTQLDATQPSGIEIRRPKQQGALDASWRLAGGPVQLNLGVTYTGENVDTDFATFLPTMLDPYTLVRLGASWKVTDQFEVYTRIENLLDEQYQEIIGYDSAPQALYIGARFRDEASR